MSVTNTPGSPGANAQSAAAMVMAQRAANSQYMQATVPKFVNTIPAGGGTTAPFVSGSNLIFTVPPVNNGYLEALEFTFNLTVTMGAGGSAINAAAPYNMIREIDIQYNGVQGRVVPYFANLWQRMRGWQRSTNYNVVGSSFYADAQISAALRSATFPVAAGANSWIWTLRIPLNAIHDLDAAGLLPIMGEANPVQVIVTCNNAIVGVDPLVNVINTGAATVTGTVKCDAKYRDGTTLWSPAKSGINLAGLDTTQWLIDAPIQNLIAGQISRGPVKTMLEHYYLVACVIDGQQSNAFATSNNFTAIELDTDGTGNGRLFAFGTGTNVAMSTWFEHVRNTFGQDMDPGIIPWVVAPSYNQGNPSNRMGTSALNMKADGWTTIYQGYNLVATGGVAGIAPRIETWLISSNPLGLLLT